MKLIVAIMFTSACMALSAAASVAADPPDFTFNVHVQIASVPATLQSVRVRCQVLRDSGTASAAMSPPQSLAGMSSFAGDLVVAVSRQPDTDPRLYKRYRCQLLVNTATGFPSSPSLLGLSSPNDGVIEGTLPPQ